MKHLKHSNFEATVIPFPTRAEIRADSERNNLAELNERLAGLPEAEAEAEPESESVARFDFKPDFDDKATNRAILALLACLLLYGMVLPFILTVNPNSDKACMPPVSETPDRVSN